jgi:hypothetical protein
MSDDKMMLGGLRRKKVLWLRQFLRSLLKPKAVTVQRLMRCSQLCIPSFIGWQSVNWQGVVLHQV